MVVAYEKSDEVKPSAKESVLQRVPERSAAGRRPADSAAIAPVLSAIMQKAQPADKPVPKAEANPVVPNTPPPSRATAIPTTNYPKSSVKSAVSQYAAIAGAANPSVSEVAPTPAVSVAAAPAAPLVPVAMPVAERPKSDKPVNADREKLLHKLTEKGVAAAVAEELLKRADNLMSAKSLTMRRALNEALVNVICKADTAKLGGESKTMLFFGPTGVGKTTSIAKLAAYFTIEKEMRVALITADVYRIAAVAQIKTYADIIDIPLEVVYTPEEMELAIGKFAYNDLILIDTAGRSHKDPEYVGEVKQMIELNDISDYFLVISATTAYENFASIVASYDVLGDYKIIMTKTDEAENIGAVVNLCFLSGRPVAYISNGQNVPDDIKEFSAREIINLLLE